MQQHSPYSLSNGPSRKSWSILALSLVLSISVGCALPPQQPEEGTSLPSENGTEAVPTDAATKVVESVQQLFQDIDQLCAEAQEPGSEAENLQAALCDESFAPQAVAENPRSSMGQLFPLSVGVVILLVGGILGYLIRGFQIPRSSSASDKADEIRSRRGHRPSPNPAPSPPTSKSSGGGLLSFMARGGANAQGPSAPSKAEEIKARRGRRSTNVEPRGMAQSPEGNPGFEETGEHWSISEPSQDLTAYPTSSAPSAAHQPLINQEPQRYNPALSASPPVAHQSITPEAYYNQNPSAAFQQVTTQVEDISIDNRRAGYSPEVILQNTNRGSLGVLARTDGYYLIPRDRPSTNEKLQDYFEVQGQESSGAVYLHRVAVVVPKGPGQWQLTHKGRISFQ